MNGQESPLVGKKALIEKVLTEHESLLGSDDYRSCVCGAETVNLGGLRSHVAAEIARRLPPAQSGADQ